jgi:hypothetical protein
MRDGRGATVPLASEASAARSVQHFLAEGQPSSRLARHDQGLELASETPCTLLSVLHSTAPRDKGQQLTSAAIHAAAALGIHTTVLCKDAEVRSLRFLKRGPSFLRVPARRATSLEPNTGKHRGRIRTRDSEAVQTHQQQQNMSDGQEGHEGHLSWACRR